MKRIFNSRNLLIATISISMVQCSDDSTSEVAIITFNESEKRVVGTIVKKEDGYVKVRDSRGVIHTHYGSFTIEEIRPPRPKTPVAEAPVAPPSEGTASIEADWTEIRERIQAFHQKIGPQISAGNMTAEQAQNAENDLVEKLKSEFPSIGEDLREEAKRIGMEVFLGSEPPEEPLPETGERFLSPLHFPTTVFSPSGELRKIDNRPSLKVTVPDNGEHYYIKILNQSEKSKKEYLFVRSGDNTEIKIPVGTYKIVYAVGKRWHGEIGPNAYFGKKTKFYRCNESFRFRREQDKLVGYEIELRSQLNGNLETERIDESDF